MPLIALHGRMDNCGVFDRIIPSLHGDYHAFSVDLPGHGLSTHYPSGVPLDFLNYIIALVCILKHFRWKRILLLGHSLGGRIGFFFAATFPENMKKMVLIDPVSTFDRDKPLPKLLRSHIDEFFKLNSKLKTGKLPVYTYDQAKHKLVNRSSALTPEAAEIVLKRALKKQQAGYNFRMDQRLKTDPLPFITDQQVLDIFSSIQCPVLSIISSERYTQYKKTFRNAIASLRKLSIYSEKVIDGNHDLHQNHPEKVVGPIDEFFMDETMKQ